MNKGIKGWLTPTTRDIKQINLEAGALPAQPTWCLQHVSAMGKEDWSKGRETREPYQP